MKNPFKYGGVITGDAFCNRETELAEITTAMKNGQNLFIYSERRSGKTSLIMRALEQLPKKKYLSAYVDVWPTDGIESFACVAARAIVASMSTKTDKIVEAAKSLFGHLSPVITFDSEGKAIIQFGVMYENKTPLLEEVLQAPAKLTEKSEKDVVIVFDEFQQILEYDDDLVERQLRSIIQQQDEVCYLFLGSRRHLIRGMFLDESRPLYRSAGHYPIHNIGYEHWLPFIKERFARAKKSISDELIEEVYSYTEGHPFYTQHLCHVVWELCDENQEVSGDQVEEAVSVLLDRESYAYTNLWDTLTTNQRRLLRGVAEATGDLKPFESEFRQKYNLGAASSVQRSVEALSERDIIDRENGSFVIVDRFFKIWIQRM